MKNNEIIDFVKNVDLDKYDKFMAGKASDVKIFEDLHSVEFDYSWLEKIEETLPFLDNLVRNPKKFIMQEEEIVPIEKAKKISLESIRHLAQHTNFIQNVAEDGTITPSQILNIHKEESFDIYENRFVYSMLINLTNFIQMRKAVIGSGSLHNLDRKITYSANSVFDSSQVKLDLVLRTVENDNLSSKKPSDLTEDKRIERVELIIKDYFSSQFIKELNGAAPVRSPIRKTNAILKNQNFRKVLELWEFIERYDVKNKTEKQHKMFVDDKIGIEDKLGITFFLNYFVSDMLSTDTDKTSSQVNKYYIKKMVNYFMNSNDIVDEVKFKKMIDQEFEEAKQKEAKETAAIIKIMSAFIEKHKKIKKDCLAILK